MTHTLCVTFFLFPDRVRQRISHQFRFRYVRVLQEAAQVLLAAVGGTYSIEGYSSEVMIHAIKYRQFVCRICAFQPHRVCMRAAAFND